MRTDMSGYAQLRIDDGVATVEFHHPKGNSLPSELLSGLADRIREASGDENAKVIVLKSKGDGAFCAGASFDEMVELKDREEALTFFGGFAQVIKAMMDSPKFIIGRVQGKVVGGGVGLVAACDYVIASRDAQVKLSELNVGIGPFVIAPVVQRKIGVSALSTLCINASEWRDADWAEHHGLFNEVHQYNSEMDSAILSLSTQLSKSSPEAMKQIRKMLWHGMEDLDKLMSERAAITGELSLGEYTQQFIHSFRSK